MSDYKIVYLIIERGIEPNRQVFWRSAGIAFICRDGSLNVRLDIHPGLVFNIRDPKCPNECFEIARIDQPEQAEAPAQELPNKYPFDPGGAKWEQEV
jgi:hypothetical protein